MQQATVAGQDVSTTPMDSSEPNPYVPFRVFCIECIVYSDWSQPQFFVNCSRLPETLLDLLKAKMGIPTFLTT